MRLADHARATRRRLAFIALLAVAGVTALTLSQCKLVDERLSGVADPFKSSATDCFAQCAHAYNDSIRAESNLHVQNVKLCKDDEACQALEEVRHEAAVERIQSGRQQCESECHHQGSGSGGR